MSPDSEAELNLIYEQNFRDIVLAPDDIGKRVDLGTAHADIRNASLDYSTDDIWIFGYGSLMWKIDFPCIDWQKGYICGYQRRFYQHSIDHRGVHVKPGRVVTLIPGTPDDRVYGVAYRVAAKDREAVLKHLDFREKNGYDRCSVTFHVMADNGESHKNFDIVIYIATAKNESWAGDGENSKVEQIAEQICTSAGPSGRNREYFFNVVKSMDHLFPGVADEHLRAIQEAIDSFIQHRQNVYLEQALKKEIQYVLDCNNDAKSRKLARLLEFCKNTNWREYFLAKELYGISICSLWCEE